MTHAQTPMRHSGAARQRRIQTGGYHSIHLPVSPVILFTTHKDLTHTQYQPTSYWAREIRVTRFKNFLSLKTSCLSVGTKKFSSRGDRGDRGEKSRFCFDLCVTLRETINV